MNISDALTKTQHALELMIYLISITILLAFTATTAIAVPREIVIVRHANKLDLPNTGPALDPTGYAGSVNLAFYFIDKFGYPDFIIAANPSNDFKFSHSIRELQTIAPPANLIQKKFPETDFPIEHPYRNSEYSLLATWLLTDSKFNNKLILVCWDHFSIPNLAEKLGVKEKLPSSSNHDYGTVYILKYAKNGLLENFERLNNQYPTNKNTNWQAVKKAFDNAS